MRDPLKIKELDSRLRGNDKTALLKFDYDPGGYNKQRKLDGKTLQDS